MKGKKGLWMCLALTAAAISGCSPQASQNEAEPTAIRVWHYYNGDQLEAFEALVEEFNDTLGAQQGIVVTGYSQGSVTDLETNVLASLTGEVGAQEAPNIFSSYADTAYTADQMGSLVDLREYLTQEEIASYVEGYIEEGDFSGEGEIKIFPVAKATEALVVNRTDWDAFAAENPVSYESLESIEGVTETAGLYYQWTDAQTPDIPDDGKALFGRDSLANYMLIGSMQLGTELFTVENGAMTLHADQETLRALWDNYYIPMVKGYFAAAGRFRSDDMKTGSLIAYVGSSSSSSYYPAEVAVSDTESYAIEVDVLPAPQFQGGQPYAIQQGAGMAVTKAAEEEIEASVAFLLWFTDQEQNIRFCVDAGYLPVKTEANHVDAVLSAGAGMDADVENTLRVAMETVNANTMYTSRAFAKATEARDILETSMAELAAADRETVVQRLEGGQALEEAAQDFCSEAYFEQWYSQIKAQLESLASQE